MPFVVTFADVIEVILIAKWNYPTESLLEHALFTQNLMMLVLE